jgi:catechol 2,3-dioxygenase-like lactoylglutathione lyase family enzyme
MLSITMIGRFHEISIQTHDIRASVEFYEQLGFTQCVAGDTWTHPYGVLTDGRIFLGLHQYKFPSPSITCVQDNISQHVAVIESLGIEIGWRRLGDDSFNEFGFRDPAGQMITLLEARTYSPSSRRKSETSLLGDFTEFSIPAADFAAMREFWEKLGFVALEESEVPYLHLPMTSDHLDVAAHRPRTLDAPMLVFSAADSAERIDKLLELDVQLSSELPRGLDPKTHALLSAPEGTQLLLLHDSV